VVIVVIVVKSLVHLLLNREINHKGDETNNTNCD
jgi:hypothetical protein